MYIDFQKPFIKESEQKRLNDIVTEIREQKPVDESLLESLNQAVTAYKTLKASPLELLETEQERQERLVKLSNKVTTLTVKRLVSEKELFTLTAEFESLQLKIYSRYTKAKNNDEILKDCLEVIQAFEPDDVSVIGGKPFDDTAPETRTSPALWFSYELGNRAVGWYRDYFIKIKDNGSGFKILKAVYDRTLDFYPQGFSNDDRKNPDCIFDKAFFKALKELNEKQDRLNYELEVLSAYKPEKIGHIIPSSIKISATTHALHAIGSGTQMTIDDFLQANKANDLVTFRGLDDDGLQFVFNENVAKKDTILVSFKNLETASGGGTAPSKVFVMALEKMNELGYFHHKVIDQAVTVSVKDLTENKAFSSRDKAKTALENAKKTLTNLQVSFYNKSKGLDIDIPWFSPIGWKDKTTLLLMPNRNINWRLVGCHLAIYPPYIYKLKTHAYKLAYYVFTQARINKAPDKNGNLKFNLSLVNIGRELGLQSVESIKNFKYKQNFLDKVVAAMKELTDTDREYYGESRLSLKIGSNKNMTPKEVIENGNLEVTIKKGELTEIYKKIRDSKTDLIESAKRKKAKQKRLEKENPTEN